MPGGKFSTSITLSSAGMACRNVRQHQNWSDEGNERAVWRHMLDLAAVELIIGYQTLPRSPLVAIPVHVMKGDLFHYLGYILILCHSHHFLQNKGGGDTTQDSEVLSFEYH